MTQFLLVMEALLNQGQHPSDNLDSKLGVRNKPVYCCLLPSGSLSPETSTHESRRCMVFNGMQRVPRYADS